MNRSIRLGTLVWLCFLPSVGAQAQSGFPLSAKVTASVVKMRYKATEPIEVTVILENVGERPFYIPKFLGQSVGNVEPGFGIYIEHEGKTFCFIDVDGLYAHEKRKSRKILKEDFFFLPAHFSVGFRFPVRPCESDTSRTAKGRYDIYTSYSGWVQGHPDFSKIKTDFPVLQNPIKAEPLFVEVTE